MIKLIKLSIFLCVMGICCVLAGCSKAQKRQIVDEQGNKIISFYTMQLKTDFSDFINGMISEFEQNNPKIKIKWIIKILINEGRRRVNYVTANGVRFAGCKNTKELKKKKR